MVFLPPYSREALTTNGTYPWSFDHRFSIAINQDFNFPIVNFPFICSNIPATPAYGVYISQLTLYSTDCASYQDFNDRELTRKLLNLSSCPKKFTMDFCFCGAILNLKAFCFVCLTACVGLPDLTSFRAQVRKS
jgi:hypothetical protein